MGGDAVMAQPKRSRVGYRAPALSKLGVALQMNPEGGAQRHAAAVPEAERSGVAWNIERLISRSFVRYFE